MRCSGHKRWRSHAIDTGALRSLRHGQVKRHDTWRAGCGESRTSGSEGGPEKPTSRKTGRALRPDPYTKLLGPEKWTYFYLYVVLDIFSRYVVGWLLADSEWQGHAKELMEECCERQGIEPGQLTIHSDRGGPMRGKTVAQLYADLGVTKTHSRPHVSNDNPFSESQFKTLKYRPEFPKRFGSQEDARNCSDDLITWYNDEHHHSGLGWLTPHDVALLGNSGRFVYAADRQLLARALDNPRRGNSCRLREGILGCARAMSIAEKFESGVRRG